MQQQPIDQYQNQNLMYNNDNSYVDDNEAHQQKQGHGEYMVQDQNEMYENEEMEMGMDQEEEYN